MDNVHVSLSRRVVRLWFVTVGVALLACDREPGSDAQGDAASPDAAMPPPSVSALECGVETFELTRVDVGDVNLNTACWGTGRTALLLHGYPELYATWTAVAEPLVEAGYRVVAPDLRGYNLSDRPEPDQLEAYRLDRLVADVANLVGRLDSEPVLVVGHDWGGLLAWVLASRRPELFRAAVVVNGPHPEVWMRSEVDPVQADASLVYVPLLADGTLGPEIVEGELRPLLTEAELEVYRDAWERPGAAAAMAAWYAANVYPDNRLPNEIPIDIPVLAIWGMDDPYVTASELDHLPDRVSDLEVVRLEGRGHWLPHEDPDRLASETIAFDAEH